MWKLIIAGLVATVGYFIYKSYVQYSELNTERDDWQSNNSYFGPDHANGFWDELDDDYDPCDPNRDNS